MRGKQEKLVVMLTNGDCDLVIKTDMDTLQNYSNKQNIIIDR